MKVYIVELPEKATKHISDVLFPRVMRQEYGIECSYSDVRRDANGKPQPISGHFFNISHSGNYWCIAFSDTECGIDIEDSARTISPRLSRRILARNERPMRGDPLRTWVLKEAYSKYRGQGIGLDFRDITEDEIMQNYLVTDLSSQSYICYAIRQKPLDNEKGPSPEGEGPKRTVVRMVHQGRNHGPYRPTCQA